MSLNDAPAPRRILIAVVGLTIGAGGGLWQVLEGRASKRRAAESLAVQERAKTELTLFEKKIIINLEALEKNPAAKGFFADLDSQEGLRNSLKAELKEPDLARFKKIASNWELVKSFREAVEPPLPADGKEEICGPAKIEKKSIKQALSNGKPSPLENKAGCAEGDPLAGNPDSLFPNAPKKF